MYSRNAEDASCRAVRAEPGAAVPDFLAVRALCALDELAEALRLRFRVFEPYGVVAEECRRAGAGIDLDEFDRFSLHFGCFDTSHSQRLVGCTRLITPRHQEALDPLLSRISSSTGDATLDRLWQHRPGFRLLLSEAWHGHDFPAALRDGRSQIAELSRVGVCEVYRRRGVGGRLVRVAVDTARATGFHAVLLACGLWHVPFYERLGFHVIPGTGEAPFRSQPSRAMCLYLS
ncbi:MAG: GNAT family N-acetyltransferase [Planctomycetes bacterium]|nr:GNAT family N-acetyltransferase [Planctomycetota bacterium]